MKQTFKVACTSLTDNQVTHLIESIVEYQDVTTLASLLMLVASERGRAAVKQKRDGKEAYLGFDNDGDIIIMDNTNPFWDDSIPVVTYLEALDIMGVPDYTDTVH